LVIGICSLPIQYTIANAFVSLCLPASIAEGANWFADDVLSTPQDVRLASDHPAGERGPKTATRGSTSAPAGASTFSGPYRRGSTQPSQSPKQFRYSGYSAVQEEDDTTTGDFGLDILPKSSRHRGSHRHTLDHETPLHTLEFTPSRPPQALKLELNSGVIPEGFEEAATEEELGSKALCKTVWREYGVVLSLEYEDGHDQGGSGGGHGALEEGVTRESWPYRLLYPSPRYHACRACADSEGFDLVREVNTSNNLHTPPSSTSGSPPRARPGETTETPGPSSTIIQSPSLKTRRPAPLTLTENALETASKLPSTPITPSGPPVLLSILPLSQDGDCQTFTALLNRKKTVIKLSFDFDSMRHEANVYRRMQDHGQDGTIAPHFRGWYTTLVGQGEDQKTLSALVLEDAGRELGWTRWSGMSMGDK